MSDEKIKTNVCCVGGRHRSVTTSVDSDVTGGGEIF